MILFLPRKLLCETCNAFPFTSLRRDELVDRLRSCDFQNASEASQRHLGCLKTSARPLWPHTAEPRCVAGRGGPAQQRLPPHLQHGAQPAARRGDQPRVHARALLLPVPELLYHPGPGRKYVLVLGIALQKWKTKTFTGIEQEKVSNKTKSSGKSSFVFYESYLLHPELKNLEHEYNNMVIPNEDSVATYYKIRQQLQHLGQEVRGFMLRPQYLLPFLQPGRLIYVSAVNRYCVGL